MAEKTMASSATVMATGTLVSRILGVVRGAMLAAAIATVGDAANAFSVANTLPTIIYMLIAGGVLNAVLVPQIVRAMRRSDGGDRYVNQLLTLGTIVLALITIVLTIGANILLGIYASGMDPEWKPLALAFTYICLPQIFFYGVYTLLGQVLNARSNFGPFMWAPALNNVVSIIGFGVYLYIYGTYRVDLATPGDWDTTRIWLVAGTATAGIVAQALVLLIPLYRDGFKLKPVFQFRGSGLGRASRVAGWAFAGLAVGQLGYLAITNLGVAAQSAGKREGLTVAGNAAFEYAFTIFMLPQSLITVSLVTAMFTHLSHHAAAGAADMVRNQLSMGLRTLAVFTVFASAALIVLAIPTVAVVFAGTPTWEAQQALGHVVVALAIGLVPIGAWTMVQRVYFAFEDTKALFFIQIPMMLFIVGSCIIAFFLFPPNWWVVVGAGVGTTLSNTFGALLAYLALRRKLPSLDGARVLRTHLRLTIAVLPPTLLGWGLLRVWGVQAGLFGSFARVVVIGTLMGITYLVLLRLLRVTELDGLILRAMGMLAPITRRVSPHVDRLPGSGTLRKIGSFFTPSQPKAGVVNEVWEAGDVIAERYRLVSHISTHADEGHSLTSWRAEDEILARTVRVILLDGSSERVARGLDSARRRAVLTDPYFPRIFRVLEAGETGVIVAESVDGPTLTELITSGTVTAAEARSILGEAARGLERAHRQGVTHLALTPSSIVVQGGAVQILGLGFEAALLDVRAKSSELAARQDSIALAQVLFAALSGKWIGARDTDLPRAAQSVSSAQELHELAPDAPLDLIRLCHLTISPFEEGPHTPAEFAESLRPWDPVPNYDPAVVMAQDFATGSLTAVQVAEPSPGAGLSLPADPPASAVAPDDEAEADLDETTGPSDTPNDARNDAEQTPPETFIAPAASITAEPRGWDVPIGAEPAVVRVDPPHVPQSAGGDTTLEPPTEHAFTPVEPAPTSPAPTPERITSRPATAAAATRARESIRSLGEKAADQFRPVDDDGTESRFNPAGFILLGMLALVVFALVLAMSSLRSARDYEPPPVTRPSAVVTETETPAEEETREEPGESETETEEASPAITIDRAVTYDPSTGGGENQDLAHRAIDGDPATFWRSLRYNSPTYAIKDGLGFSIVLEEPAEVSEVVLLVNGAGGKVEVRAEDPQDPTRGTLLASGSLDHETTLTFDEPVETGTIVLWFPELPVADSDGMNRIELAEVQIR